MPTGDTGFNDMSDFNAALATGDVGRFNFISHDAGVRDNERAGHTHEGYVTPSTRQMLFGSGERIPQ